MRNINLQQQVKQFLCKTIKHVNSRTLCTQNKIFLSKIIPYIRLLNNGSKKVNALKAQNIAILSTNLYTKSNINPFLHGVN